MQHYVAYHSVQIMGGEYTPGASFSFMSRKSESLLRSAIDQRVWVLVGERRGKKTTYVLAGVYRPDRVERAGRQWEISGKGDPFRPPRDVTSTDWLATLMSEQSNFSLGFNRIKDRSVIAALEALAEKLPDAVVFERALESSRSQMSDVQVAMLRAHYFAQDNVLTARQLGEAAGLKGHEATNLHYGKLGSLLRGNDPSLASLGGQQSYALASFENPGNTGEVLWRLHRPLVDALENLRWFDADMDAALLNDGPIVSASEGQFIHRYARHRHREQSLRVAKILETKQRHPEGRVVCEVPGCGFDFELVYGELGVGFAEVHHIVALSTFEPGAITRLDDLVVVCANCHRMIHRGNECRAIDSLVVAHDKRRGR